MGLSCDVMHILTGAQRPMEEGKKFSLWGLNIYLSLK